MCIRDSVCTLQFEAPIWMSLPAQVSKMGVIFKVIMDINATNDLNDLVLNTRQVVTFNNYGLLVTNGQIRILQQGPTANVTHTDNPIAFWDASNTLSSANLSANLTASPFFFGSPLDWTAVLGTYGNVRPGVSQIGLSYDYSVNEILGTITVDPTDPTILLYNANVATLPANTLPAIISIVNPEQDVYKRQK